MFEVLVVHCSSYGPIEAMARAMAECARSVSATVDIHGVLESIRWRSSTVLISSKVAR